MSAVVRPIRLGAALLPSPDLERAISPLVADGTFDAVEWNLDFGFDAVPPWIEALLDRFGPAGALYAHGVEGSLLSALLAPHQLDWLDEVARVARARPYRHLTEHYGFLSAGAWVRGTPLPLPPSRAGLALGVDRLRRLADRAGLPVGVENLGFAWSADDALAQADFVGELVEKAGAFLLFDVHNAYCQAHNYALDPLALAARYPLDRARELHVAGGTEIVPAADPARRAFRRDSHDEPAPEAVLALVEALLPRCPSLEVVIVERTDRSLFTASEVAGHHAEVRALRRVIDGRREGATPPTPSLSSARVPLVEDEEATLDAYQRALLDALGGADASGEALADRVARAVPALYASHVAHFEPRALEVGLRMVRQWGMREAEGDRMPAVVLRDVGRPLELWSLPMPSPGPGQVLLRVACVGLCGTDVHAYEGRFPVPRPIVLGHETVGTIEEVGPGVTDLVSGERVGVSWVQRGCGACAACGAGRVERCPAPTTWIHDGGGLSAFAIAEASGCTRLPDGLPFALAAPIFCAGHVAMSALVRANVQRGERVAVLGLGGLGHLALGLSVAAGHETMVITSSVEKIADALAMGANEAFAAEGAPGDALAARGGADVILATTSSMRAVSAAVAGLRTGGRLVLVGLGEGELALDPVDLVQREASVIGAVQGGRAELAAALALAGAGKLVPRVEVFPLVSAHRGLTRLAEGRARYRVVIDVEG